MKPEPIDDILRQLAEISRAEADDATYHHMRTVRLAVRRWKETGASGEMPHQDELQEWGITIPSMAEEDVPSPLPSATQVQSLLEAVRQRIRDCWDDGELEQLENILDELLAWREQGMQGPPPRMAQLSELGLWPEAKAEIAHLAPDDGTRAETAADLGSVAIPADAAAEEFASSEPAVDVADSGPPDPDDARQADFDEAQRLLDGEQFYGAKKALATLKAQVSGRLVASVESGYGAAAEKLEAGTKQLAREAAEYAAAHPDDRQGQRDHWARVLEFNPDSGVAQQALAKLERGQVGAGIAKDIEQIRRQAQSARDRKHLPDMHRAFADATVLQSRCQGTKLAQQADGLVGDIARSRAELRDELGAASTAAVGGDHREAYKEAREAIDGRVPVLVDAAGLLGEIDAEVETRRFFDAARTRFLDSLCNLTSQRLSTAKQQQIENPELALATLQDAYDRLTDKVLTLDDKGTLATERDLVERDQQAVSLRLERYRQAQENVLAARAQLREIPPEKRLRLLEEAKTIYPDYPDLDTFIRGVHVDLAAGAANRLRSAMVTAEGQTLANDFEGALQTLRQARETTHLQVPDVPSHAALVETLIKVGAQESLTNQAKQTHVHLMGQLGKVDEALRAHDEGDPTALSTARRLLESLTEEAAEHPETRKRLGELADRQGDQQNWEQGRDYYQQFKWADAESLLTKAAGEESTYRKQALPLAARAKAGRLMGEAHQAKDKRQWSVADDNYAAALAILKEHGSDTFSERIEASCREALKSLEPLTANDRLIQDGINDAEALLRTAQGRLEALPSAERGLEPLPEFGRAVKRLKEAREAIGSDMTTMMVTWQKTREKVRDTWRQVYLQGMRQAVSWDDLSTLRKAGERASDLESAALLYNHEDKELARKLKAGFLDAQLARLERRSERPYAEIEANRQQRLELERSSGKEMKELQKAFETARRQRVQHEIGQKQQESPQTAYAYLKQEMDQPGLYADEWLLAELMRLCWRVGDWPEAKSRTGTLAYHPPVDHFGPLSQVWDGLTTAARHYTSGDHRQAGATIVALQGRFQEKPDLLHLIRQNQQSLVEWRLETLVREASEELDRSSSGSYLGPAKKYAEAEELAPGDPRVRQGLEHIGPLVAGEVELLCRQATTLMLGSLSLSQGITTGHDLQHSLQAIQRVFAPLKLRSDLKGEITDAMGHLTEKLKRWEDVQRNLDKADGQKSQELLSPTRFTDDEAGGWNYEVAESHLVAAQIAAGRDVECQTLADVARIQLDKLVNQASALNVTCRALVKAIQGEEFDAVISQGDLLRSRWPKARKQGFGGLDRLLRYQYPETQRQVTTLSDHISMARQQKLDLDEWTRWAKAASGAHKQAERRASWVRKPLVELRDEHSLDEIAAKCTEIIAECTHLEARLKSPPRRGPLSDRARKEKERVDNGLWETEFLAEDGSARALAGLLLNKTQAVLKDFTAKGGPLQRLKTVMRRVKKQEAQVGTSYRQGLFGIKKVKITHIPKASLDLLEQALESCAALDPLNAEVIGARKLLRKNRSQVEDSEQF